MDAMASAIYVPAMLFAGVKLGEQLGRLDRALDWVGDRVFLIVGLLATVVVIRQVWRRYLERIW